MNTVATYSLEQYRTFAKHTGIISNFINLATFLAVFRRVAEAAMAELEPIHQGVAPTSSLAFEN